MKIVINTTYGGFNLSGKAIKMYRDLGGITTFGDADRNDPILIGVIESMGANAAGYSSKLKIVEIPDDVEWQIDSYDGVEWVAEKHRTWN